MRLEDVKPNFDVYTVSESFGHHSGLEACTVIAEALSLSVVCERGIQKWSVMLNVSTIQPPVDHPAIQGAGQAYRWPLRWRLE